MSDAVTHCERLVRDEDPDRAVALAFAPADRRGALSALYAFNIETARVRDQIRQPLPGEIRLQWWRDRIAGTAGRAAVAGTDGGVGHPVADALDGAIVRFGLPFDAFDRFLEQRTFDLYDDPMPSRQDFESYAGGTASALIMLAAMILDVSVARQVSDAAGHAGVAQAAAGVLRLLPIHRRRGQVFIPADLLDAAGCSRDMLLSGDVDTATRAILAMTAFARQHLAAYEVARAMVGPTVRAAFLPAELTGAYIDRIEEDPVAALEGIQPIGPLRRSWTYWRSMRR